MSRSAESETFKSFFERWVSEQKGHLQDLIAAAAGDGESPAAAEVIGRVIEHYDKYYRAKRRWARRDVVGMLTPRWRSSLEDAFFWIGGWRPTMAFHLLYSKSGIQLQSTGRLRDLIGGATSSMGDLTGITQEQLAAVDALQRRTIRDEKDLSEKMAKLQETVAGPDLVELSHAAAEAAEERFEAAIRPKERGFEDVLEKADELRLRTLKGVVEVLTTPQTLHFLIAAAELHLGIHEWGLKRDAAAAANANNRD